MADAQNPLIYPQREKAGSQTKAKYAYQYHWALYRAIQEHSDNKEYAVFVELHEDVILCDSLEASKAKFEFNQVKTTASKYTKNALLKPKNGLSPLGKLISSAAAKPFSDKISQLNFVAISGFGIVMKTAGLDLKKITISDIDDTELSHLALLIKNEISITPLPAYLQFIIPDLSEKNYQNDVIAEIAKLISILFPGSNYNPIDIYRVLIDEINRKGEVTYDFAKWDELLKNKALTCTTVTTVINQFTNLKDQAKIEAGFSRVMGELNLNVLQSISMKKSFDRYLQLKIGSRTLSQLDTSKAINVLLTTQINSGNVDIEVLLTGITNSLATNIKRNFASEFDLRAAIICELIMEH